MTTPFGSEPKARRTHARRSCNTCKVRKTRCELPDLDVPSSAEPLPKEKACHRCSTLCLPCVVDDSRMKKRKRSSPAVSAEPGAAGAGKGADGPARRPSLQSRASSSAANGTGAGNGSTSSRPVNVVNNTIDVRPVFGDRSNSTLRLHGRPLTLVSELLSGAGKKLYDGIYRRLIVSSDIRIEDTVDQAARKRLAPRIDLLRTYHPHLQDIDHLFDLLKRHPDDISMQFLLCVAVFLGAQSMPEDAGMRRIRDQLGDVVTTLLLLMLAHRPDSFYAIQALEICSLYAPFAPALPYLLTDPRTLAQGCGIVEASRQISEALNFSSLVLQCRFEPWGNPDFWLWAGVRVAEAQSVLEAARPRKPADLASARAGVDPVWKNDSLWAAAAVGDSPVENLGKLTVCDRLYRADDLHNSLQRLYSILDAVVRDPSHSPVPLILHEVEAFNAKMIAQDQRHDHILGILKLSPNITASWLAYRALRRRWVTMKQVITAFHILMSLHFLPGFACAVPNLPSGLPASAKAHYALDRALNANDILTAWMTKSTVVEALRAVLPRRAEAAEQLLTQFVHMARGVLVPVHDVLAMTVEACKALVEIQVGIWTYQRPVTAGPPPWLPLIGEAGAIMRSQAQFTTPDPTSGGETIANGCANILGSLAQSLTDCIAAMEKKHWDVLDQVLGIVQAQPLDIPIQSPLQPQPQPPVQAQTQPPGPA